MLLTVSKNDLTNQQKQNFATLARHYDILISQQCDCDDSNNDREANAMKDSILKQRRQQRFKRNSWDVFIVIETLHLVEHHQRYLNEHDIDPLSYIVNQDLVMKNYNDMSIENFFMIRYKYTSDVNVDQATYRLRWFFTLLFYYDLIQLIHS